MIGTATGDFGTVVSLGDGGSVVLYLDSGISDGSGDDFATSIATFGGHVMLTGAFEGNIDFGGGSLKSEGNYDLFVASFLQ